MKSRPLSVRSVLISYSTNFKAVFRNRDNDLRRWLICLIHTYYNIKTFKNFKDFNAKSGRVVSKI